MTKLDIADVFYILEIEDTTSTSCFIIGSGNIDISIDNNLYYPLKGGSFEEFKMTSIEGYGRNFDFFSRGFTCKIEIKGNVSILQPRTYLVKLKRQAFEVTNILPSEDDGEMWLKGKSYTELEEGKYLYYFLDEYINSPLQYEISEIKYIETMDSIPVYKIRFTDGTRYFDFGQWRMIYYVLVDTNDLNNVTSIETEAKNPEQSFVFQSNWAKVLFAIYPENIPPDSFIAPIVPLPYLELGEKVYYPLLSGELEEFVITKMSLRGEPLEFVETGYCDATIEGRTEVIQHLQSYFNLSSG